MKWAKKILDRWQVLTLMLVVLISIPFLSILFSVSGTSVSSIPVVWIEDFAFNTYLLLIGTSFLTLLLGVPTAWLLSNYRFPGSKWLSWALVIPLSIPAYIQVYTYKGMLGPFGTMQQFTGAYLEVENVFYLMLFMSSVLYPYVYLGAKSAFAYHSGRLIEAVKSLGGTSSRAFIKVILPLARPAIFGGLFLVLMEVFNNYGAVSYFGFRTFTTEIIRLWNPLDLQPVLKVSSAVLVLVLFLLIAEKYNQNKIRIGDGNIRLSTKEPLQGWQKWGALSVCLVPFVLGFVLPVVQLLYWASKVIDTVLTPDFGWLAFNTFKTAFIAAIVCMVVALIIQYTLFLSKSSWMKNIGQLSNLGYAVPGAVIGVGVLFPLAWLNQHYGLLLTGTVSILIFAYTVRFISAANNSLDAGFKKMSPSIHEASISLGKNKWQALFQVHLPLLKPVLLSTALLVFVDVTKELPLTMLFHSFNFETLAVRAFILMETDGVVYDSSVPALIIIIIGMIPTILLNKLMTK